MNSENILGDPVFNQTKNLNTALAKLLKNRTKQNNVTLDIRVGKKYRYAGIPRYFFGVVRTAAHLSVPRYSDVSIFSNRKS